MSEKNVEVVRRFFDARNRRDIDGMLDCMDPAVEFDLTESRSPYRGTYRGHVQVRRLSEDIFEAWDDFEMALESPLELGDEVVVSVLVNVSGRGSGAPWSGQGANVFTVKHGKIVRFRLFQGREDALKAVGLAE